MKRHITSHVIDMGCIASPFPASFNGSAWLFGAALASIMAISAFGLIVAGWMVRDIFRDRKVSPPMTPLFAYRSMVGICGFVAFLRSLPQLAFMTTVCERDIQSSIVSQLLTFTRYVDIVSLPSIVSWMLLLVLSYPYITLALSTGVLRNERFSFAWALPRLARPAIILIVVIAIAALMAWAKAHGIGR